MRTMEELIQMTTAVTPEELHRGLRDGRMLLHENGLLLLDADGQLLCRCERPPSLAPKAKEEDDDEYVVVTTRGWNPWWSRVARRWGQSLPLQTSSSSSSSGSHVVVVG